MNVQLASEIEYKQKALSSLSSLPPFSPILNRLLATLANEDISFAQLAAVIEKDTVLAGNVLRTVNSPLFGFSGTINSVSHAISIMGLVKLRNTALGISVNRMWKSVHTPPGWSMARFNLHSLATAMMADLIAQRIPVNYAEGAFVSGLFHDLGKLLIALGLSDRHQQIARLAQDTPEDGRSVESLEREVLGVDHAELSGTALALWNLPRPVQMAATYHHSPNDAPKEYYGDCKFHLGHVVYAANRTVSELGITIAERTVAEPAVKYEALLQIGLEDRIPKLLEEFHSEYEAIRSAA